MSDDKEKCAECNGTCVDRGCGQECTCKECHAADDCATGVCDDGCAGENMVGGLDNEKCGDTCDGPCDGCSDYLARPEDIKGYVAPLCLPPPLSKEDQAEEMIMGLMKGGHVRLGVTAGGEGEKTGVFKEEVKGGILLIVNPDGEEIVLLYLGERPWMEGDPESEYPMPVGMALGDILTGKFDIEEQFKLLIQDYLNMKHGMLVRRKTVQQNAELENKLG